MSSRRAKKSFMSEVQVTEATKITTTITRNKNRSVTLSPRNANQEAYLTALQNHRKNIVFALGPAGTGKTMLAVQCGIKLLQEGKVDKIVITRPAVSVDEDLGFLPGTLNEKMAPWTRPIFDVFGEYYSQRDITRMLDDGIIEISPLAYMRGRTFKYSFIVADECQLTTPAQMKMLLTRIGENSKLVITGDLDQADRGEDNGLLDFTSRFEPSDISRIHVATFTRNDIERHPVVEEVIRIYK